MGTRIFLATLCLVTLSEAKVFSSRRVQDVQSYWNEDGRYIAGLPDNVKQNGAWQVRLTVEGSVWLRNYSRSRGIGKSQPNLVATSTRSDWEAWINAKIAWDRANAALAARKKNVEQHGCEMPKLIVASDPGPAPADLAAQVGQPPLFAEAVMPRMHRVKFEDSNRHAWLDNPDMRPRYEYYRFKDGVQDGGTAMRKEPEEVISQLLKKAGIEGSVKKVFAAVSLLEGGFDSINTYDTGFVSVGFIQFACLTNGAGSLGQVMLRQRTNDPASFERDFRRFGLDVAPSGSIIALDISSGEERIGPEAAQQIIKDKRLIGVFQRAGRLSEANRIAQLQIAKQQYYPAGDSLLVPVDGRILSGTVGAIIKSEAGLATLMDRKVNTGKLDPILPVLQGIARTYKIQNFDDFAKYELEIVEKMRWRKSYLEDSTLSQPVRKPDNNSQGQPIFPPK
ncbi:MAG: hypothetical protein JNK63_00385 [Chthonomonas sp.]|nr:hypothetical protein [Chthonomonas sp.]